MFVSGLIEKMAVNAASCDENEMTKDTLLGRNYEVFGCQGNVQEMRRRFRP